jgi:hypothetical protein
MLSQTIFQISIKSAWCRAACGVRRSSGSISKHFLMKLIICKSALPSSKVNRFCEQGISGLGPNVLFLDLINYVSSFPMFL